MMRTLLRVHIVPVGFDNERVTEPIIKSKGDRVYLISRQQDDLASNYLKLIKKELKKHRIEFREEFTDIWDLMSCMEKFREIVIREKENQIFFNVSTGSTLASIAAMLTCMIWKCEVYYVQLQYPNTKKQVEIEKQDVDKTFSIPVYKIMKPEDRHLLILSIIKDNSKKIKKKDLIERLKHFKIIRPVASEILTTHAEHSQLNAILRPMVNEQYLEVESRGRSSIVKLTEQGENALKIFGEGIKFQVTDKFSEELDESLNEDTE